jgi:MFS family permease
MPDASVSLFRDPGYARVWLIGLFCGVVRWLEMLAFGLFAFDITGSPALVALLVMLRFLPLALFGVFIGALADLVSPLKLLIGGLLAVALIAAAMLALFLWGSPQYWHVAAAAFLSGLFWACDMPFRRKMIGDMTPPERLAEAMSLDGATANGTRMLGPLVGGLIYQLMGISSVFALGAALYLASIAVALTIRYDARGEAGRLIRPLSGAIEALRYARSRPDILNILGVTVLFNLWGFPYLAMLPVIGKDELGLSDGVIGLLSAMEGGFALIGALAASRWARPAGYRQLYFYAVLVHFVVVFVMGTVTGFWVLALGLAVGGLCTAVFAAMQATLIYMAAPEGMRGRFLGLMSVCIGAGILGFANVGLTAELFGGSNALWIIALEGLIPILWLGWRWRELR